MQTSKRDPQAHHVLKKKNLHFYVNPSNKQKNAFKENKSQEVLLKENKIKLLLTILWGLLNGTLLIDQNNSIGHMNWKIGTQLRPILKSNSLHFIYINWVLPFNFNSHQTLYSYICHHYYYYKLLFKEARVIKKIISILNKLF